METSKGLLFFLIPPLNVCSKRFCSALKAFVNLGAAALVT